MREKPLSLRRLSRLSPRARSLLSLPRGPARRPGRTGDSPVFRLALALFFPFGFHARGEQGPARRPGRARRARASRRGLGAEQLPIRVASASGTGPAPLGRMHGPARPIVAPRRSAGLRPIWTAFRSAPGPPPDPPKAYPWLAGRCSPQIRAWLPGRLAAGVVSKPPARRSVMHARSPAPSQGRLSPWEPLRADHRLSRPGRQATVPDRPAGAEGRAAAVHTPAGLRPAGL
jgi:hypothetical protein